MKEQIFSSIEKHADKMREILDYMWANPQSGFREWKANKLLLDAYNYKKTEWEFLIAQAASRPHMSKRDGKDYIQKLDDKLQGLDEEQGLSRFIKENT